MRDMIEFYDGTQLVSRINSYMVPPVGASISIRGKTWTVAQVTYAIDYSDNPLEKLMRANVDLKESV